MFTSLNVEQGLKHDEVLLQHWIFDIQNSELKNLRRSAGFSVGPPVYPFDKLRVRPGWQGLTPEPTDYLPSVAKYRQTWLVKRRWVSIRLLIVFIRLARGV